MTISNQGFTHEPRHSEQIEWYTPPHIFQAIGLTFDIDVCSAGLGNDHVPASARFTKEDNGLVQPWHGLVWCNPPYGKYTAQWMNRMKEHNNGIALVFARTGTRWWHQSTPSATTICFIKGRLQFINGTTGKTGASAGADSVLIAWGTKASESLKASGLGICMRTTS